MHLPLLTLSNLSNLAVVVVDESQDTLSQCMATFAQNKENDLVQIVAKERSLYEPFRTVHTTYDSNKYAYVRGSTYLFDDCFGQEEWWKDSKLYDCISYPRLFGLTSVFGFRRFPALPTRMCWNLDLICLGKMSSTDRKFVYDRFFLYLLSYEEFCELLETYTRNGFLVLRREGTQDVLYQAHCGNPQVV